MGGSPTSQQRKIFDVPFIKGIGVTLLLAIAAKLLSTLPFLSIMGQLVIAILLGMIWSAVVGVPHHLQSGISFSSKKLLRVGIILLGMRLNLVDIYNAGIGVFVIALINLTFAILVVYGLTRLFGVEKRLGILTACGTGICGAAAVVAVAPQVDAKDEEIAVGAAIVALLGTTFTFIYSFIYSLLPLSPTEYGVFAGGTLHEIAHVVAAASVGGDLAIDMAIIVKLTRVALLVPVALLVGFFMQRGTKGAAKKKLSWSSVPWFIIGFLVMSGFNSLGIVSDSVAKGIVNIAYLLIAMAMAGLGLNVEIKAFREHGLRAFSAGLIGSVLLSVLGYILVLVFL